MTRRAPRRRRILGVVLMLAALLGAASTSWAYWTSTGSGIASATTATLNPPTNVVASFTPGLTSVAVTWTAPTAGLAPQGYYVTRTRQIDGVAAPACGSSTTSLVVSPCSDPSVAAGTYRYTVTAVYRSWTSTSGNSNTVTVVPDTAFPVVTVTRVNGATAAFPLRTNVTVTSFGGACGTAAGDSATVTPLIDGAATDSATCTSGSWTLTLSPSLSADATVILSASQSDLTGNIGTAPAQSVTIDRTRPTLSSIARAGASQSVRTGPLSWTVTFSEPVSAVVVANFGLVTSGLGGTPAPSISGVSTATGPPSSTWTVSASPNGATATAGSIRLDLTNSGSIADAVGNTLSTTGFTGEAYTFDTTKPTVTRVSATLPDGSYKAIQVVPVTVAFTEPVIVTGTPQLKLTTGTPATTP